MRAPLLRLFWRQFEGAIALPVYLSLLLKQGSKAPLIIVTLEGKKRSLNVKSG